MPFDASRRLTGPNLFFDATGAVLEVAGVPVDEALLVAWRLRVERARARLGWVKPDPEEDREVAARPHALGASLALAAPCDQLLVATEINEWALCAAVFERDPLRWQGLKDMLVAAAYENAADPDLIIPPELDEEKAFGRFERLAALEVNPRLRALLSEAAARGLQQTLDDTTLTLGAGCRACHFASAELPDVSGVAWSQIGNVPTAVVTGSNGKTTTVRLLASCARAHGWQTAYSCTEGVFLDREPVATGDYSGPAGARMAIREPRAQAAILETARGGILRRGIAVSQANVAVITNVSSDHFGEYGIDDLDALTEVKLTVAAVVPSEGLLVLNADDARLRAKAGSLERRFGRAPPLGWFALDADDPALREHRSSGGSTCGVRDGRLCVAHRGAEQDLGPVSGMPLTVQATARYNIANLAGAALAAVALGIPPATIASVYARFGADPADNLGRMMRFDLAGVHVLLDYAHNSEGLRGLLTVAEHLRAGRGRLGLLLGQAGNRRDSEIEQLARVAAEFRPDLVVVKENEGHLRGREQGELPRIIRAALLRAGLTESALAVRMSELEAARCALDWGRPGDVLALPVHSGAARAAVLEILAAHSRARGSEA